MFLRRRGLDLWSGLNYDTQYLHYDLDHFKQAIYLKWKVSKQRWTDIEKVVAINFKTRYFAAVSSEGQNDIIQSSYTVTVQWEGIVGKRLIVKIKYSFVKELKMTMECRYN